MALRNKLRLVLALFTLVLTGIAALAPAWAYSHADGRDRRAMKFEDMRRMRALYSSLLPVQRLRNESSAHYLHLQPTLKMITSADASIFGPAAGSVNFRKGWHPKPYSTDQENGALFQLAVLAGMGHHTMVNANIPEMKDYCTTILKMLAKISEDTKLSDLSSDLNQIAQQVSDPTFTGGPTKALDKYDKIVIKIADRVEDVYLKDGFWYYTAGITLAGLHAIPGKDWFNAPYFRDMLQMLYNHYPSHDVPFTARYNMKQILRSDYYFNYRPTLRYGPDMAREALWALFPKK